MKNLLMIIVSLITTGCATPNYNNASCSSLAHDYNYLQAGNMSCYKDENTTTCRHRLMRKFAHDIDTYFYPYLEVMKSIDSKHENPYKIEVKNYMCGDFCEKLRTEIMRLYNPKIQENRYQSLKAYKKRIKHTYTQKLGVKISLSKKPPPTVSGKVQLTLDNLPPNCSDEYNNYLQEKQAEYKNIRLLGSATYDLNACIEKEQKK
ncbi:MAG TPA: hypothetical protein EYG73_00350 [Arcobacter sp.]|nr:hypothetical protein [Arcobacter sp.]